MYLAYIDDSRDETLCVFSALIIPVHRWRDAFTIVKNFRRQLKRSDGISVHSEFHAWKFVSGRGNLGTDKIIGKVRRCQLFNQTLSMVATLPNAKLINVCLDADKEGWAFERLLNRINRNMQACNGHIMLMCDEGKDEIYTRLCRRMGVYNPIPSKYGSWDWNGNGALHKNIPIERIIEDPIFKDSKRSYFVQLADFCAYALLRREHQLPSKNAYGLHKSFDLLAP
ncbi:MAG TPA: DUF3800 domain-containing protein, partial [Pyrinomonadaceae bacterium]